jgi:hypothetical protein
MNASGNVLAHSIHHKEPLTPELDGRTGGVLVLYERLFGDEALGRAARLAGIPDEQAIAGIQNGSWDPFSDELLGQAMGEDPAKIDSILTEYT